MDVSISELPEDVLMIIFSFLEVEDRLRACLVCKNWLKLMSYKFLLKDIQVCFSTTEDLNIVLPLSRNFLNFSFHSLPISKKIIYFLQLYSKVESVKFFECYVDRNNSFAAVEKMFLNLKELIIVNHKSSFNFSYMFGQLPNLSNLEVSGKNISDHDLSTLGTSIRKLEKFTLHCSVVCEPMVYRRFYPPELTYEESPSQDILSIIAIKKIIATNKNTLSDLSLSAISATALKELSKIEGLNLRKFSFSIVGCSQNACYESLAYLFSNQKNIEVLQLKNMIIPQHITQEILTNLINLKELSINYSIILGSENSFFELPNLHLLDIFVNDSIPETHETIQTIKSDKLKYLNLRGIQIITSHLFSTREVQNLSLLTLRYCKMTDQDIQAISKNLKKLQFLDISFNSFSDPGITGYCLEEKQICLELAISNLKSLRYLDLSMCRVTEIGLTNSVQFSSLVSLLIYGYKFSEGFFPMLHSKNPKLENVIYDSNIGKATYVRQKFLNYFSENLTLI